MLDLFQEQGRCVVTLQADLRFDPTSIRMLLACLAGQCDSIRNSGQIGPMVQVTTLFPYKLQNVLKSHAFTAEQTKDSFEAHFRSVNVVSWSRRVDFSESKISTLVKDILGVKALVFIISIGRHAPSECFQIIGTELLEDVLARCTFIFSGEAIHAKSPLEMDQVSKEEGWN